MGPFQGRVGGFGLAGQLGQLENFLQPSYGWTELNKRANLGLPEGQARSWRAKDEQRNGLIDRRASQLDI